MENTEAQRKKGLWVEHPHRRNKNAGFSIPEKWYICFLWGRGHFIFSENCYNCCLLTLSGSRFLSKASIKFHPNLKDKTKKNEQYYSSVSFLWRFSGHLIQWCVHAQLLSCVWLFVSSWTVAHQATLSMDILQSKNTGVDYISYSKGSSQCRNQTQISCIADGFFTVWATGQRYLKSNASSKQYCQTNFGEVKCTSLEKSVPMDHRFCCSVIKSYLTLCTSMNCSTLGWPVLQYLPEFSQTHVHWVSDVI